MTMRKRENLLPRHLIQSQQLSGLNATSILLIIYKVNKLAQYTAQRSTFPKFLFKIKFRTHLIVAAAAAGVKC
jgi:hypothetical protein